MAAYLARSVSSSMRFSSSAFSASCLIFCLRLIQQPAQGEEHRKLKFATCSPGQCRTAWQPCAVYHRIAYFV